MNIHPGWYINYETKMEIAIHNPGVNDPEHVPDIPGMKSWQYI